ncbi:MAG: hypothetical protein M0T84_07220 [Betaproteobacteria bacterium]|nr:hypothetical protein [Betaproteobacteria bacterium]
MGKHEDEIRRGYLVGLQDQIAYMKREQPQEWRVQKAMGVVALATGLLIYNGHPVWGCGILITATVIAAWHPKRPAKRRTEPE